MAACSSEIDSTVFLRWRQPTPTPAAEAELRRQQLREDFQKHFCSAEKTKPEVVQPKQQLPPKVNGKFNFESATTGAQPVQVKRSNGEDRKAADIPTTRVAPAPAAPPQLRYVRLLSPSTRANRWMHTTWHHLPPNPDTSRGNCRASHFSSTSATSGGCCHFRIHPDWGWDVPPPSSN